MNKNNFVVLNSPTDKTGENLNLSSTSFGFDRLILARKALIMLRFWLLWNSSGSRLLTSLLTMVSW